MFWSLFVIQIKTRCIKQVLRAYFFLIRCLERYLFLTIARACFTLFFYATWSLFNFYLNNQISIRTVCVTATGSKSVYNYSSVFLPYYLIGLIEKQNTPQDDHSERAIERYFWRQSLVSFDCFNIFVGWWVKHFPEFFNHFCLLVLTKITCRIGFLPWNQFFL